MDTVRGMDYSLETGQLTTEVFILKNLLQWKKLSVNIGGNFEKAAATVGWDLDLPITLHGGVTKSWKELNDWTKKPGIFIGFEMRF